jgi:hypothetical protein
MRCAAGSVAASGGKSAYDAQHRSAGSLADAVQLDHPFLEVPAAGRSAGLAGRTLLFAGQLFTDFCWPMVKGTALNFRVFAAIVGDLTA